MADEIKLQPRTFLGDARCVWRYWKHSSAQYGGLFARLHRTALFARELRRYEEHRLDSESLFKARR